MQKPEAKTSTSDGDVTKRILQWTVEDECLASLFLHRWHSKVEDDAVRDSIHELMTEHEASCGGNCMHNVQLAQARTQDPLKKRWYRDALQAFMIAWLEQHGGHHKVSETPQGWLSRTGFSSAIDLASAPPYTQIEVFRPRNRAAPGHVIFDVRTEALFEDPRPLIQHLDVTATRELKHYPSDAGPLHWRTLCGENEPVLMVRWQGKIKEIAKDWTLQGRYGGLVNGKQIRDPLREVDAQGRTRRSISRAEAALRLREIAMGYDERSWFMGYLATRLLQRSIDEFRRSERDPLQLAESLDSCRGGVGGWESSPALAEAPGALQAEEESDGRRLLAKLISRLDQRQKQILAMKREGLTDAAVGERVGYSREGVNRQMRTIRKIARKLTK